jgi:hypothetical protein
VLDAIGPNAAESVDEIVPVTREAIEAAGLDYAPTVRAAQTGELRTVRQGRRRLTTRVWLLAYVTALPPASARVDADDDVAAAARKRALRVAS